jgi:hypothetical protein
MADKAKKTKKQRKWGRNAAYCLAYKNSNRREHNKVKRLKKHLVRFPDDLVATVAIENCMKVIRGF